MKSAFLVPGERKPSQFSVNSTRFNTDTFCGSLRVRIHGVRMYPGGYSHTLPIRVCASQRGRDFEAPDLGRGIHFRGVF